MSVANDRLRYTEIAWRLLRDVIATNPHSKEALVTGYYGKHEVLARGAKVSMGINVHKEA